jgi:hypothetical protein
MGEKIAVEVIVGLVALAAGSIATWLFKEYGRAIKTFFSDQARANAKLISGRWKVKETYSDNSEVVEIDLDLTCVGEYVTGEMVITGSSVANSPEKGKRFSLKGATQNRVINLTWQQIGGAETGTLSVVFNDDPALLGHGLYVFNQKVCTSDFRGVKP